MTFHVFCLHFPVWCPCWACYKFTITDKDQKCSNFLTVAYLPYFNWSCYQFEKIPSCTHRPASQHLKKLIPDILRLIYTLRFVGPICRPRQIRERIGACEWRSDGRATPIRQVGRFRKICDCFTDFPVSGPILRTKTQPAKELAQNKLYLRYFSRKQTN